MRIAKFKCYKTARAWALLFPLLGILPTTASAQALDEFHPVLVTSSSGTIDSNSERILVETFSAALKSGALKTLGREFYGVGGESFAGVGSKGPIGVMSRFLKQSDAEMAMRLAANYPSIKPPTTDAKTQDLELYWTKRNFSGQSSSMRNNAIALLLKMLMADPSLGGPKDRNPFSIEVGSKLPSLQTVRMQDVPGGKASLVAESRQFLQLMVAQSPNSWFPISLQTSIMVSRDRAISTRVSVSMKPVALQTSPKESGDFIIDGMKFDPSKDKNSIFTAVFERKYSPADIAKPRPAPVVDLSFGSTQNDSLAANICVGNDCLDKLDKVPTIYARLDSGWLWNFLAETLSLNEFKILVNTLAVDIDQMEVVGPSSELPIILRTQTWGWKVVDMRRNTRPLNPIEAIQKSLIGDSVSQGLSGELKKAGDKAEQSLNATLKPIVQFLQ